MTKVRQSLRAAQRQLLLLSPIYLRRLRITNDEQGWQWRGDKDLISLEGEMQQHPCSFSISLIQFSV